jgi:hypothetical protein
MDPPIFPEDCCLAITHSHGGRSEEKISSFLRALQVKAMPGPVLVGSVEPLPSEAQGHACMLKVLDAQATKCNWPRNSPLVYMAAASIRCCSALPKKPSFNPFQLFEDFLRRCKC